MAKSIFNIPYAITQYFDTINPKYGPHNAVDYAAPLGTPVYAVGQGIVSKADSSDPLGGLRIGIDMPGGLNVDYAHLSRILVSTGQPVRPGQLIGYTGSSGSATTGPHLHFAARKDGTLIDPLNVFNPFSGENKISELADIVTGITKDALARLPTWAKPMEGTQAYSGMHDKWRGLPVQIYIPGERECSEVESELGGYVGLSSPSIGNPPGTKVCTLPGNVLADAVAAGGDAAAGIADVGAFFVDAGAFLFDGSNWLRILALLGGTFLTVRGVSMIMSATGTPLGGLPIPTPKLPGV